MSLRQRQRRVAEDTAAFLFWGKGEEHESDQVAYQVSKQRGTALSY